MTYWTILWITALSGPLDGVAMGIFYPSIEACTEAHQAVSDTIPYDHTVGCESTGIASSSLRPRRRPA